MVNESILRHNHLETEEDRNDAIEIKDPSKDLLSTKTISSHNQEHNKKHKGLSLYEGPNNKMFSISNQDSTNDDHFVSNHDNSKHFEEKDMESFKNMKVPIISQEKNKDNHKNSELVVTDGFGDIPEILQLSTDAPSSTKVVASNKACEQIILNTTQASSENILETDVYSLMEHRKMTRDRFSTIDDEKDAYPNIGMSNQVCREIDSSMKEYRNRTEVPESNHICSDKAHEKELSAMEECKNMAEILKSSKDEMYSTLKSMASSSILSSVDDDHNKSEDDSDLKNLEHMYKTMKALAVEIREKYKVTVFFLIFIYSSYWKCTYFFETKEVT